MSKSHITPIYWSQGQFLVSQHFQYQQQYLIDFVHQQVGLAQPDPVGIYELKLCPDRLSIGTLSVTHAVVVMPDSTQLFYPGNCVITSVDVDKLAFKGQEPLHVVLELANLAEGESNLSTANHPKRFQITPHAQPVTDLLHPDSATELHHISYDAKLRVVTTEQLEQPVYQTTRIEIARLRLDAEGIRLCDEFIPRVHRAQASDVLVSTIEEIADSLLARYEQLSAFNIFLASEQSELTPRALSQMFALQVLAKGTSQFHQLAQLPNVSPHSVYNAGRELISELAIHSSKFNPLGQTTQGDTVRSLPAFAMDDLTQVFKHMHKIMVELLGEVTIDPELVLALTAQDQQKFCAQIIGQFIKSSGEIYLRLRSHHQDLIANAAVVARDAKLGADGQVDIYHRRALPGIPLQPLSRKPLGVAAISEAVFFKLDINSHQWLKALETGRIALIWPQAPDDLIVELVTLRG